MRAINSLILLTGFICTGGAFAQDSVDVALPEVTVSATRTLGVRAATPLSLVSIRRTDFEVRAKPGISLEHTLRGVPGLFMSDRNYFAVGERLIVRGMGSRAPFGVRGVQVNLDGIPLSLPDGQAVADIVEPSLVSRVELIRGPASVFWGNGSGGALLLSTTASERVHPNRIRLQGGSSGLRQVIGETSLAFGPHRVRVYGSNIQRDGYRRHSAGRFTRGAVLARFSLGSRTILNFTGMGADQSAEHPGSLTLSDLKSNPRQASGFYERQKAGKDSRQLQFSSEIIRTTGIGIVSVSGHWIWRTLRNPLPFAFIDLDRTAGGIDVAVQKSSDRLSWAIGVETRFQSDSRKNWDTVEGERGDELGLNQREEVFSAAARSVLFYSITRRLGVAAGVRWDRVRFKLHDALLANGDDSGRRSFESLSPVFGISFDLPGATLYADVGSAFETPTTTELVNRPDLTGGFNPDLDAQKTLGLEAGVRAHLDDGLLEVDIAAYRLVVDDRLVAYQTEAGGDRTFFRNGGRNIHRGIEVAMRWALVPDALIESTVAIGRFEFEETALDGKYLPGVPEKQLTVAVTVTPGPFTGRFEFLRIGAYFVDDNNTIAVDGYSLIDLTLDHDGIALGGSQLRPFASVGNVFDVRYISSVTINSSSGRYFDPGSGRTIQAGLNLSF